MLIFNKTYYISILNFEIIPLIKEFLIWFLSFNKIYYTSIFNFEIIPLIKESWNFISWN